MGQLALLLALGALLLLGVVLLNTQRAAGDADDTAAAYHTDRLAREAALVGLQQAQRRLNADPDGWALFASDPDAARALFGVPATTVDGATYAVALDSVLLGSGPGDPDEAWVTATGSYGGYDPGVDAEGATVFTVVAKYEKGYTDLGTPPSMRAAIITDQNFDIRGNAIVSGDIHANGTVNSSGSSFDVLGQGSYTTSGGSFDPDRFTGGVAQSDSIPVPDVTIPPASYHYLHNGNLALSASNDPAGTLAQGWFGVTGKGTAADPYVLVVNGNLTVSGDVRLLGHCRIYVTGTMTMNGNASLSPVSATPPNANTATNAQIQTWIDTNLPGGSTIGLYTGGDVTVSGTMFLAAHLYTHGAVRYTGGGHKLLIGGITSQGSLDLRGNTKVFYTDANASIFDPGLNEEVPDGLRLIAYREWVQRPSDPTP
jgi:hypothetical protein